MAIPCHYANILLRDGLAPAGGPAANSVSTLASTWRRWGGIAPIWKPDAVALAVNLHARSKRSNNGLNAGARLGKRQREARSFSSHALRPRLGNLSPVVKGKWVRPQTNSVKVALSKEVNLLELYNLKRSYGWNFYGLKEILKEVPDRPYSAHVFCQR